jgi:hypothetical protein
MNKLSSIFLLFVVVGCTFSQPEENSLRIIELKNEIDQRNKIIDSLELEIERHDLSYSTEIGSQYSSNEEVFWYAFKPNTEHNIVKLSNGESINIDEIELSDSVDTKYRFDHAAIISQIKDLRLDNLLSNFVETRDIYHESDKYGPMADNLTYYVRVLVVCEEPGLPIETENCTSNIYILVEPTELGFENNLFRISRLYRAKIKKLEDSKDGIILTLEHSKFPPKDLKVLIKPQLVKFIK